MEGAAMTRRYIVGYDGKDGFVVLFATDKVELAVTMKKRLTRTLTNQAITHLLLNKDLTTDEVNNALDTLCNEYGTEAVARAWMAHATHKPQ